MSGRPVRIGDTVKIVSGSCGFTHGVECVVRRIDVLNSTLVVTRKRGQTTVRIADVEIISSPSWQLKLL